MWASSWAVGGAAAGRCGAVGRAMCPLQAGADVLLVEGHTCGSGVLFQCVAGTGQQVGLGAGGGAPVGRHRLLEPVADLAVQRLGGALQGGKGLNHAALGLRGRDRGKSAGKMAGAGTGEGQAARRVVQEVQLALSRGQVGGLGVQPFRVGEEVGASLGRGGGALRGQGLDGAGRGGRLLSPCGRRAAGGQGDGPGSGRR